MEWGWVLYVEKIDFCMWNGCFFVCGMEMGFVCGMDVFYEEWRRVLYVECGGEFCMWNGCFLCGMEMGLYVKNINFCMWNGFLKIFCV